MPLKRLHWITSEKFAEGYPHETEVFAGLRARGIEVLPTVWNRDPVPRPGPDERVIVRTPWDYLEDFARFNAWLDALPAERVENPVAVLRWNSKKDYLRELEAAGVRIVPTVWMEASSDAEVAKSFANAFAGRARIVKPVLSASAKDTYRLAPGELPPAGVFLDRPAMIQPFLPEIESDGERSLVYFSGRFSHGIRKVPKAGDFRVQESHGGIMREFSVSDGERVFGDSVLAAMRARFPEFRAPLYARVDYVLSAGKPQLMELELLEPDLYFHHAPGSAERFVEALLALS
ncbi:MAG: hypothetical protein JST04_14950 [Bdellovibrionales bacterium]|nr:hypothetical protein [Bdellovibrionales bacterium]